MEYRVGICRMDIAIINANTEDEAIRYVKQNMDPREADSATFFIVNETTANGGSNAQKDSNKNEKQEEKNEDTQVL